MSTKSPITKVITSACTVSYPHFDKPQPAQEGQKAKYSGAFVFTPAHQSTPEGKATMAALSAAAIAAATDKFGATITLPGGKVITVADALREGILASPFRKDALAKGYEEGSIFLNARTEQQPGTVYSHKETGSDKPAKIPQDKIRDELYAGAQVRVSLTAFGYNTNGKKGVSFALNNVQKVGEGDRLDSRVKAEDEFTADLSQAPADLNALM